LTDQERVSFFDRLEKAGSLPALLSALGFAVESFRTSVYGEADAL
jgi:hypothetical protein